ncbi:MAG: N-formylglutamate amidohydrolase [Alphaproteobacteria bacterium]|nr:N-formylglutamate amidohydrolase [Alphaproteobacteria bacterium]
MAKIVEFPPFERVAGEAGTGLLLLCDHASNHVPTEYGNLGLPPEQFERHIAYDIGTRDLTLGLARRLGAPAVLSRFSRLLIDPNRGLDDPTLIMRLSDGAVVPGNRDIDAAERQLRIERFHAPYHRAVTAAIDAQLDEGVTPLIVSLHSFTPMWKNFARPWHVGILWDRDAETAQSTLAGFAAQGDLVVGDNEPYHGALAGDTMDTHANARSLPHVLIEIRQDLIAAKSGVDEWVERVARVLEGVMKDPTAAA